VSAYICSGQDPIPAENGMRIQTGGGVETGEASRARLDLLPGGTIIRVGPNSTFVLVSLTEEGGETRTRLELVIGKLFVLLNGDSLEIETPSGVASVRGSLLSVEYDSERSRLEAACLEGECALVDVHGFELELPEGEYSVIDGDEPPTEPKPMLREDIEDWLEMNPDLGEFMEEVPDPEDFPEAAETEADETIEQIIEELPIEPPPLP